MNVYFPRKYEIEQNYNLKSLKHNSDRILETIEELKELLNVVYEQSQKVIYTDFKYIISVRRYDYRPPIHYEVEVNKVCGSIKVYECSKKFSGSEKKQCKAYIKEVEEKYNVKCDVDYRGLKL